MGDAEIYVPGVWRCPKCRFRLIQANLNTHDGTVTARDNPGDRCPNCSGPLWRVTWKDEAEENLDIGIQQVSRAVAAEKRCQELLEANNRFEQDGRNWRIVERLRVGEGSSVEILCDNADFNGQPNNAVVCNGDWTDWQSIRFTGDTIAAALGAAMVAFTQWSRKSHD